MVTAFVDASRVIVVDGVSGEAIFAVDGLQRIHICYSLDPESVVPCVFVSRDNTIDRIRQNMGTLLDIPLRYLWNLFLPFFHSYGVGNEWLSFVLVIISYS